jgi:hypothetical protein
VHVNAAAVDDNQLLIIAQQTVSVFVELPTDRISRNDAALNCVDDVSSFADEAGAVSVVYVAIRRSYRLADALVADQLIACVAHDAHPSLGVAPHASLTVLYANSSPQSEPLSTSRAGSLIVCAIESACA